MEYSPVKVDYGFDGKSEVMGVDNYLVIADDFIDAAKQVCNDYKNADINSVSIYPIYCNCIGFSNEVFEKIT